MMVRLIGLFWVQNGLFWVQNGIFWAKNGLFKALFMKKNCTPIQKTNPFFLLPEYREHKEKYSNTEAQLFSILYSQVKIPS